MENMTCNRYVQRCSQEGWYQPEQPARKRFSKFGRSTVSRSRFRLIIEADANAIKTKSGPKTATFYVTVAQTGILAGVNMVETGELLQWLHVCYYVIQINQQERASERGACFGNRWRG